MFYTSKPARSCEVFIHVAQKKWSNFGGIKTGEPQVCVFRRQKEDKEDKLENISSPFYLTLFCYSFILKKNSSVLFYLVDWQMAIFYIVNITKVSVSLPIFA